MLVTQSYPNLCDATDCSLSGSSVHGIFQARILEWVAISSSRRPSWLMDQTCISCGGRWILTTEPLGKPTVTIITIKASACNAGDLGSIPWSRRSPGEGNGNPLLYCCLENPMDGGALCLKLSDMTEGLHFTFSYRSAFWLILLSWNVDCGSGSSKIFATSRHSFDSL